MPASRAAAVVCGPMLTAGMADPSRANARAADAEASTTRSPSGGCGRRRARACGRARRSRVELIDEQPPRALGSGEEHAAGRARQLGQQAFLRRDGRDEVGAAEGVGGRLADRGDPLRRAGHAAPQLAGAVDARHDHPVVAGDVEGTRRRAARPRASGQWTTSCRSATRPRDELLLLARADA